MVAQSSIERRTIGIGANEDRAIESMEAAACSRGPLDAESSNASERLMQRRVPCANRRAVAQSSIERGTIGIGASEDRAIESMEAAACSRGPLDAESGNASERLMQRRVPCAAVSVPRAA